MYIYDDLVQRAERPVQVGLIGAGKFGSMFLSQVPTTVGLEVKAIAELDPDRARQACRNVGWSEDLINKTAFFDSTQSMIDAGGIDVLVESTTESKPRPYPISQMFSGLLLQNNGRVDCFQNHHCAVLLR